MLNKSEDSKQTVSDTTCPKEDSIVLNLEEFDLSNLDSLEGTVLGNVLEKLDENSDIGIQNTAHTKHSSHSSHAKFSQSLW